MKPNLIIDSNKFYSKKYNYKTNIYIIKKKNLDFINNYFNIILNKLNNKFITFCLDFEFNNINNKRQIALFQLSINNKDIIMFNPLELTNKLIILLKNILTHKNSIKIMHGSESLDIIYLFENIFINNKEKILFMNNFYDTKFLCEYENIIFQYNNKKCKIYELLLKNNIINNNIYKWLIYNEKKMGPIYDIIINVNNMNKELIYYTLFDVFYLEKLLKSFKINKNQIKIISEILQIIFIYKKQIDNYLLEINKFNLYFIILYNNNILTLNDIYLYYKGWLTDNKNNINILYKISYFKKCLDVILKKIIYENISKRYIIYEKKNNEIIINFNNSFYKIFENIYYIINQLNFKINKDLDKMI